MSTIVNKIVVLSLNGNWLPIRMLSVKDAIVAMTGGTDECPPAHALDIEYEKDENGNPLTDNIIYMNPVKWEDWIKLPIRPWDLSISSVKQACRVPTVIVNVHFKKMPVKKARPTKMSIAQRDKFICQYSGQLLTKSTANIDHVIPKARGGQNTWSNMVLCHKDLNSKKGHMLNEEIGYKLIKIPKEPVPMPISAIIKDIRNEDHKHFIVAK